MANAAQNTRNSAETAHFHKISTPVNLVKFWFFTQWKSGLQEMHIQVPARYQWWYFVKLTLYKRSPYSELFWSVLSRIRTEYGEILTSMMDFLRNWHCVRRLRIRNYSDPCFPAFGLNTPYLSVFSPNAGKYRPE